MRNDKHVEYAVFLIVSEEDGILAETAEKTSLYVVLIQAWYSVTLSDVDITGSSSTSHEFVRNLS